MYAAYVKFLQPKQKDEELHRKELVCNTILLFVLVLTTILNVLVFKSFLHMGSDYSGINPFIILSITGSIICLLYLSRIGYVSQVSHVAILLLIAGCVYGQIIWGADLPSVILLWAFIITASSILISTRYSFFLSVIIGIGTIFFVLLEQYNVYTSNKVWKNSPFRLDDAIEYAIVFTLIAGVSWLSNREIFRSLQQVKISKQELQKERDQLEIKVRERTFELHNAQIEKINSMYQLVEFGRISSGLFHDLMTPLNTLSFSINNISKEERLTDIKYIEQQLSQCIKSSARITNFISLAKKQIHYTGDEMRFDMSKEIENVASLLQTKARLKGIDIIYTSKKRICINGSPTIFNHIMTNLISNAIDAYDQSGNQHEVNPIGMSETNTNVIDLSIRKKILIYLRKKHHHIEIKVRDFGSGIPLEIQSKIFDPFFTTKSKHGCGIGLSATKHSLEKYFKGFISFTSSHATTLTDHTLQPGTTFLIKIPVMNNGTQSTEINQATDKNYSHQYLSKDSPNNPVHSN